MLLNKLTTRGIYITPTNVYWSFIKQNKNTIIENNHYSFASTNLKLLEQFAKQLQIKHKEYSSRPHVIIDCSLCCIRIIKIGRSIKNNEFNKYIHCNDEQLFGCNINRMHYDYKLINKKKPTGNKQNNQSYYLLVAYKKDSIYQEILPKIVNIKKIKSIQVDSLSVSNIINQTKVQSSICMYANNTICVISHFNNKQLLGCYKHDISFNYERSIEDISENIISVCNKAKNIKNIIFTGENTPFINHAKIKFKKLTTTNQQHNNQYNYILQKKPYNFFATTAALQGCILNVD